MRTQVRSLPPLSGLRIWCGCGCGVGHKHGSDPTLLWLWCRLAAATWIQPLAWELPNAMGASLKSKNKTKQNKKQQKPGKLVLAGSKIQVLSLSSMVFLLICYECFYLLFIYVLYIYLFIDCCICSMQKFPGQGLNLCHSSDHAKSLTAGPPGNSLFAI